MQLSVAFHTFSKAAFEKVARHASRLGEGELPAQLQYLYAYLKNEEVGARTLVVETPYVDRHYLAEYQGYYASALRGVERFTTRVHAFSTKLSREEVAAGLSGPDQAAFLETLQNAYLGYFVLRPLPSVPVGRTVLRWYPEGERCFGPRTAPHRVHVFGVTLKAYGMQFQQQDMAVGACATAALWTALSAVMRRDGLRSPTPLAVTQWAHESLPVGRGFPAASGLTLDQVTGAIHAAGYAPDVFKPSGDGSLFELQVLTYLRSGIPVVLQLKDPDAGTPEGHMVTAVGFRPKDGKARAWVPGGEHGPRSAESVRLYVHDDRLGPYARMVWGRVPSASEEEEGEERVVTLHLEQRSREPKGSEARLHVWTAVAPLYPKIRISARDLLSVGTEVWPLLRSLVEPDLWKELAVEPSFALNGDYRGNVWSLGLSAERAWRLGSEVLLSRYLGLLRFTVAGVWFADVLVDATDLHREAPRWGAVLAIIPASEAGGETLRARMGAFASWVEVV